MNALKRFLRYIARWRKTGLSADQIQEYQEDLVLALFNAYCHAARAGYPDSPLLLVTAALAWLDPERSDIIAESWRRTRSKRTGVLTSRSSNTSS